MVREGVTIIKIDKSRGIATLKWNSLIRIKPVLIQELKEESHSLTISSRDILFHFKTYFLNKITNVYLKQNPKSIWFISDIILGSYWTYIIKTKLKLLQFKLNQTKIYHKPN
jgi:hypothetical protein